MLLEKVFFAYLIKLVLHFMRPQKSLSAISNLKRRHFASCQLPKLFVEQAYRTLQNITQQREQDLAKPGLKSPRIRRERQNISSGTGEVRAKRGKA